MNGANTHPVWKYLKGACSNCDGEVTWNFKVGMLVRWLGYNGLGAVGGGRCSGLTKKRKNFLNWGYQCTVLWG